jgi:hypothetical protein
VTRTTIALSALAISNSVLVLLLFAISASHIATAHPDAEEKAAREFGAACYREGNEAGKLQSAIEQYRKDGIPVPASALQELARSPTVGCRG